MRYRKSSGEGFFIEKRDYDSQHDINGMPRKSETFEKLLTFDSEYKETVVVNDLVQKMTINTLATWNYRFNGIPRWLSAEEIRRSFCCKDNDSVIASVSGILNNLVRKGVLQKNGVGRGAEYRLDNEYRAISKRYSQLSSFPSEVMIVSARNRAKSKINKV